MIMKLHNHIFVAVLLCLTTTSYAARGKNYTHDYFSSQGCDYAGCWFEVTTSEDFGGLRCRTKPSLRRSSKVVEIVPKGEKILALTLVVGEKKRAFFIVSRYGDYTCYMRATQSRLLFIGIEEAGYVKRSHKKEIKKLQQMLKDAGYYLGSVDGVYGKKTKQAYETYNKQVRTKLDQFYGNYDAKRECWVVPIKEDLERHYCMEITKSDIIHTKSGKRNYLLLTSDVLDNEPGHTDRCLVGLFIIRLKGTKLLAAEPEIPLGCNWGIVPKKWNLIKLAPSDYWGWQTNFAQSTQGCYQEYTIIFAPYSKMGIKELTNILVNYDNGGAGGSTEIVAKIKVDNSQINKRVFPLKVKVTGKVNGKKLKVKTWELPFDTRKWQYIEPKNWPLVE